MSLYFFGVKGKMYPWCTLTRCIEWMNDNFHFSDFLVHVSNPLPLSSSSRNPQTQSVRVDRVRALSVFGNRERVYTMDQSRKSDKIKFLCLLYFMRIVDISRFLSFSRYNC
jgi:hypothetical protein